MKVECGLDASHGDDENLQVLGESVPGEVMLHPDRQSAVDGIQGYPRVDCGSGAGDLGALRIDQAHADLKAATEHDEPLRVIRRQ